jgi:site-specific DNA-cytosine methylase
MFCSTCAFDSNATASGALRRSFPYLVIGTTFEKAMTPGSSFLAAASVARVGFASPPRSDISVVNRYRNEGSARAELAVDCVRALAMVQHEVFVIESVPNIASARGGHLLTSIYMPQLQT